MTIRKTSASAAAMLTAMRLTDKNGLAVTDTDLHAPPVVNVLFNGAVFGEVPPDDADLLSVATPTRTTCSATTSPRTSGSTTSAPAS